MTKIEEPKTIFGVVLHDMTRLGKILSILAKYGFGSLLHRLGLYSDASGENIEALKNSPEQTAQRLCQAINELGVTYVKFGQMLSTRSDLLPKAYIDAFQTLQDQVNPLPFETIRELIEEALGPLDETFADVEEAPLGSASIAQVHRATLHDGRKVVLKVQRPHLLPLIRSDIDILLVLARAMQRWLEGFEYFDLPKLVEAFEVSILTELDFGNELKNIQYFVKRYGDDERIALPTPDTALSSERLLVLKELKGQRITNLQSDAPEAVRMAQTLVDLAYAMIFEDGVFHADPHAGNLLVTDDGKLGLLDFGLVGSFSTSQSALLTSIVIALYVSNTEMIAHALLRLGKPTKRVILRELEDDIRAIMQRYLKDSLAELDAEAFVYDFLQAGQAYGVQIPTEFSLAVRALIHIESIILQLHPSIDITDTLSAFAKKLLASKNSPIGVGRKALQHSLAHANFIQSLPSNLTQVLLDLQLVGLPVQISNASTHTLQHTLSSVGQKLSIAIILGALLWTSQAWDQAWARYILQSLAIVLLVYWCVEYLRQHTKGKKFKVLKRWGKKRRF